jgi:hypothetical protein
MNIYEKLKVHFDNFDLNTTFQSLFAVIASITIDSVLSWVYVGLALLAFRHNVKLSIMKQELEQKKLTSESKKIDIENEKLSLENERYKIETEVMKNNLNKQDENS